MKENTVIYSVNQGFEDGELHVKITDVIQDQVSAEKDGLPVITFLNKNGGITKF